jgi:hypothetical protein
MDDCLRCHAMHFEGGIGDLVTPLDRKGPWTFVNAHDAPRPPCPASPATPSTGGASPFPRAAGARLVTGPEQEIARPSLALYDRRAFEHVGRSTGCPCPPCWRASGR